MHTPWKEVFPAPYYYDPLPYGRWIRLLHLEPAVYGYPVQASLEPVQLETAKHTYEVQYNSVLNQTQRGRSTKEKTCEGSLLRLGTGDAKYPVWIGRRVIYIRHNLYQFLRRVRLKHRRRVLWTDAICKCQYNVSERNHQVDVMYDIYHYSYTTLVFLCEPYHRSESYSPTHRSSSTTGKVLTNTLDYSLLVTSQPRRALELIISDQYWTRLWIVQEIIAPSNVQVMAEWDHQVLYSFAGLASLCYGLSQHGFPGHLFLLSKIVFLNQLRKQSSTYHFVALFERSGTLECANIRDRVFGLKGLVPGCPIEIDYTCTLVDLLASVTRAYPDQTLEQLPRKLFDALEIPWNSYKLSRLPNKPLTHVRLVKTGTIFFHNGRLAFEDYGDGCAMNLEPFADVEDAMADGDEVLGLTDWCTVHIVVRQYATADGVSERPPGSDFMIIGIMIPSETRPVMCVRSIAGVEDMRIFRIQTDSGIAPVLESRIDTMMALNASKTPFDWPVETQNSGLIANDGS